MKLARADLWSLEEYAETRPKFRQEVMAHKKLRRLFLHPNVSLHFEDALTMKYQVQEMLRVERIFEREGIQEEIDTYNALIPDGNNWKATMLIEFDDPKKRVVALQRLHRIEDFIWAKVGDDPQKTALADQDMDRSDQTKTAAVHFLEFQFTPSEIADLRAGRACQIGISHRELSCSTTLSDPLRSSLIADFND